jgi:predicted amidohydrolase YtcJ
MISIRSLLRQHALLFTYAIGTYALGAAGFAAFAPAKSIAPRFADLVMTGGQIYTPNGWAHAIAIRHGVIIAVGSDAAVAAYRGTATQTVALDGKTVFPGLQDMHVHPFMAGIATRRCQITQGADGKVLLDGLSACVRQKRPGEWVTGGQWEAGSLGSTPLNRQTLDAVAPDNPVVLVDISAHSWWANSRALALAGIDRDTANPPGGIIERDAVGEPTGVLRESAGRVLLAHVPAPSDQETREAIDYALRTLLSYGVTSLTDAVVTVPMMRAYAALADQHLLKTRVIGCMVYGRDPGVPGGFEEMLQSRHTYARERFAPTCVKIFMDGVPTDSHTAALLEPYAPGPDGHVKSPERGLLIIQPSELDPLVTRLDQLGLAIKFHAVGDLASRTALDAIAKARTANGAAGPRHVVGHLTFIQPTDLARAKALGVTLEFSPYLWFPSPIDADIASAVGPERIERVWPVREGIDSGALVIVGSDWSIVPSPNPWVALETLVTRKKPGDTQGSSFGPAESITLNEAIRLFTVNAARQAGSLHTLGTIARGKSADLIVLDRNPLRIPITEVHDVQVLKTYIGGEKVFDRSAAGT